MKKFFQRLEFYLLAFFSRFSSEFETRFVRNYVNTSDDDLIDENNVW